SRSNRDRQRRTRCGGYRRRHGSQRASSAPALLAPAVLAPPLLASSTLAPALLASSLPAPSLLVLGQSTDQGRSCPARGAARKRCAASATDVVRMYPGRGGDRSIGVNLVHARF